MPNSKKFYLPKVKKGKLKSKENATISLRTLYFCMPFTTFKVLQMKTVGQKFVKLQIITIGNVTILNNSGATA